jgi:slime mold repeat-containing protein
MNRRLAPSLALLLVLGVRAARAGTGDTLCDPQTSTAQTCVITGIRAVPDGTTLDFTAPDVDVRGTILVQVSGQCSVAPAAACTSDGGCTAPARCLRPRRLSLVVAHALTIENRAEIDATGQAVSGDRVGPDGGTVTISAHDVTINGFVYVFTQASGVSGVPAGSGGQITVQAPGSVTVGSSGRLNAAAMGGGCGGSIAIDGPATLDAGGTLSVVADTYGGVIQLGSDGTLSASGILDASNTNSNAATRPACGQKRGGGQIALQGGMITFTGSATARGRAGGGGVVRIEGTDVTVDAPGDVTNPPIWVTGGDPDAFTTGGGVFLLANGGNVTVQQGAIEANGLDTGVGSDAGEFTIRATSVVQCPTTCEGCAAAPCVETGGDVVVQAPISARGGLGTGSGCVACEVGATRSATVAGPVHVGGGKRGGVGGKVTLHAGTDLTVGPGDVDGDASSGGDVILVAGEVAETVPDLSGVLRVLSGTSVHVDAFDDAHGVAGRVTLEGCDVEIESQAELHADGGLRSDGVQVKAHDRLALGPLATVTALPGGPITLSYAGTVSIAPTAVVQPPSAPVLDPMIAPCPACGNGIVEVPEECDGPGTCPASSDVCQPAGTADQCTCRPDTCGTVPGVQPGEDCDGGDLAGATCASLGFASGTLACRSDCTFDASGCIAVCGDGLASPGEACDPGGIGGAQSAFRGETCASRGFDSGGTLACTADCSAIVVSPHCAAAVATRCSTDADCGASGPCLGGCIACGNGFVDPGEECDGGVANGSAPNHCRADCRLPICGDEIVDFSHCSSAIDTQCTTAADCAAGQSCIAGEACDRGTAVCTGGANDGRPCCTAAECPGGTCGGNDCSRNRDDVPGCCRCDCTKAPITCGSCDDGNPCTTDRCDPDVGCTHATVADGTPCSDGDVCNGEETCRAGTCAAGAAPSCDDGDACTVDRCDASRGCLHDRLALTDVVEAIQASLFIPACSVERVPPSIVSLMHRARALVADAGAHPRGARALLHRAERKLRTALRRIGGSTRLSPPCTAALGAVVGDLLVRTGCLSVP